MNMKFSSGHFYGNTLQTFSTAEIELTETTYTPALELAAHAHESAYFCFVIEGKFTESYGRRSRSCRPSMLVFHRRRKLRIVSKRARAA